MESYAPYNLVVIALTCGISFLGFRDPSFKEKYLFRPEAILAWRQYYRVITSGFLHQDLQHLAMNMLSLYFFGPVLEDSFGPGQFLLIYFGAMVGGDLLSLYVHRHHDYRALGASGGVAGVILAYIFLFPGGSIMIMFLPIGIPGWLYGIAYLLFSFYGMQGGAGNVGHDAHLGGALAGMFTAAALHPDAIRRNPWLFSGIAGGTALLFIYLARNPFFLPLEGFDFARRKNRPAASFPRFSLGKLFRFKRGADRAVSAPPGRLDRRVDEILKKISEDGIHSLTETEKTLLKEASETQRRRAAREKPKLGFPF
jgi:membrane associated rhomboid family serine protease